MKKNLRAEIKNRLSCLTSSQISMKSRIITGHVTRLEQFKCADVVMIYLAIPGEVDTTGIAEIAWDQSKTVVAPMACDKSRHMKPAVCQPDHEDALKTCHGLRQPLGTSLVEISSVDLIVVPALAYDAQCNRLGRGGGFYDRFLDLDEMKASAVGICFAEQIVPELPMESNDKPVDIVVTDHGICARRHSDNIPADMNGEE